MSKERQIRVLPADGHDLIPEGFRRRLSGMNSNYKSWTRQYIGTLRIFCRSLMSRIRVNGSQSPNEEEIK